MPVAAMPQLHIGAVVAVLCVPWLHKCGKLLVLLHWWPALQSLVAGGGTKLHTKMPALSMWPG